MNGLRMLYSPRPMVMSSEEVHLVFKDPSSQDKKLKLPLKWLLLNSPESIVPSSDLSLVTTLDLVKKSGVIFLLKITAA
jgi:hypothetical protein